MVCILPDHPEEGLQEVQTASELGCSPDIVLTNCMFGLFLLQRYAAALEAAERLFQLDQTHGEVYLWDWRLSLRRPQLSALSLAITLYSSHLTSRRS